MSEKILHVFSNEVPDWVIAYDPEDAIKVWEETIGQKYDLEEYGGEFVQDADDFEFTLFEEEQTNPEPIPPNATLIEKEEYSYKYRATCREWADARGRCFLGSAEY